MSDFRSDTLTVADTEMREAMAAAEVGDDFYGEDPTVLRLESRAAELLGKEAALMVPSGTFANVIALSLVSKGDQVLAHVDSDINRWEAHTLARLAGLIVKPLSGQRGRLDLRALERSAAEADPDAPLPGVVAIENPHSASGGRVWSLDDIAEVADICDRYGLPLHIDGARLFNACNAGGYAARDMTARATTVSLSLYKGLGAPMGSLVCGDATLVKQMRHRRRNWGITFRQRGHMAAAGLVALDRVERLSDDHQLARELWTALAQYFTNAQLGAAPESNIVTLDLGDQASVLVEEIGRRGVRITEVVPGVARFVTHAGVNDADVRRAVNACAAYAVEAGS